MRYRSIPAEVEAILWDGTNDDEVKRLIGFEDAWLFGPHKNGREAEIWVDKSDAWITIRAPWWIIREPDGIGFYPCDPAVFAQRWQPVTEPADIEQEAKCKWCGASEDEHMAKYQEWKRRREEQTS